MTTNSDIERLETALRRSLQRQGAIARFGTRALVAIDLDALLQQAVEEVALAVDAEYVKIMEYRSGSKELLVRAGVGWKEGVVGHATLPVHMRSPAWAIIPDQRTDPHHRYPSSRKNSTTRHSCGNMG